jgi:WD40 repeat protein
MAPALLVILVTLSNSLEPALQGSQVAPPKNAAVSRVDLYGDPLPLGALARMGTIRFGHGDSSQDAPVLAPDRQTFATISNFGPKGRVVCLWDVMTGKELLQIHDPDFEYYHVFFLKSEALLGTIGYSRKPTSGQTHSYVLHFWDPKTGKKAPHRIEALDYDFEPWAISPNEKWLATASRNPPVVVRDLKSGKRLAQWHGAGSRVSQLAFSSDGRTVAIGCENTVYLWDWTNDREIQKLEVAGAERIWFSPDSRWLAASNSGGVRVWETERFTEVQHFKDPPLARSSTGAYPHDIRFFPDGNKIVSLITGTIWEVASGKECGRFDDCEVCRMLEFTPDGKTAIGFALGCIRTWDAATGKDLTPPAPPVSRMMFHQLGFLPDGKTVVSASPDGAVHTWDAATGKKLRTLIAGTVWDHQRVGYMRVGPDGTIVVIRDKIATLFKGQEQAHPIDLSSFPADILSSANLSPDGKTLVLAGHSPAIGVITKWAVQVWDVPSRKLFWSFTPPANFGLESLGVAPSTRQLAAQIGDSIYLVDGKTGQIERKLDDRPRQQLEGKHDGGGFSYFYGIQALGFSPAGDWVVSAGHLDGSLKLLAVSSGKTRHVLVPPSPLAEFHYELRNAVFSPDGAMLAAESDDGGIAIWETASGKLRQRFDGHRSYQTTLAFSPDSTKLATGNRDATILIWDVFGLSTDMPPPPDQAVCWDDLKDTAAKGVCETMGRLIRHPDSTVPFLKQRLLSRQSPSAAQFRQWLADLDSEQFAIRQKASAVLGNHARLASPLLKQALDRKPSLEMHQRIQALLRKAESDPFTQEDIRDLRAVEILEHIGSQAALQVLQAVTEAHYDPLVATAAKAASTRLVRASQ